MATQLKLRSDIKKLKKAIETKGISVSIKDKLKLQLEKAENELATLKSTGKAPKKSSVVGTKTALTSLQKLVQKNKKYAKYRGAGVDLKKDAGEPAFKTGRRVSKGLKANQFGSAKENKGNVYYEYRPNRLDVKQPPKRYPKLEEGGYMADGGETGRIVMIPTYVVKEIKESVEMGYDTLVEGMIGRKRRGVALINQDYQVRGTYDIGLKDAIEDLIKKIKVGNFEVDAVDKKASGGMMADGGNFVLRWQDPKNGGQEEEFSSKKDAIEFVKELYKYKDFLRYADKYEIPRLYDNNNKEVIDAYELQYLAENSGRIMADGGSTDVVNAEISTIRTNIMGTISFLMKIKGMKKPQEFIVYPISADQAGKPIMIQSDTRIGVLDLSSGSGLMSQSHPNGAYGHHFQMDKKVPFKINETDLQRLKDKISDTAGSSVGTKGIISDNSGANMMASGGYMAKGGIYSSDSLYILTISKDGKIIGHEPFRAKNMKEAREIAEDMEEKYTSKHGKDLEFSIKEAMASGGYMANGGKLKSAKNAWDNGKPIKKVKWVIYALYENELPYTPEEGVELTYKKWDELNRDVQIALVSVMQENFEYGGINDEGQLKVINLGGDRYDGGLFYEIRKESVVQRGTIDGEEKIKYNGKEYDGLKSLAEGIGAKLVIIPEEMKHGGVLSHNHKLD